METPANAADDDQQPSLRTGTGELKLTRKELIQKLKEDKKKEEEKNLTFKPQLLSRGRDLTITPTNGNRFEKLYKEAKEKSGKKPIEDYSFQPQITELAKSKQRASTPEGRTERLHNSTGSGRPKEEATDVCKFSFKPKITKRAKSLERRESSATRLHEVSLINTKKKEDLKAQKLEKEVEECTFKPQIKVYGKFKSEPDGYQKLSERMEKYIEQRQKKIDDLKKEREVEINQVAPMKPTLYTSKHRRGRSNDSSSTVFNRLSTATSKSPITILDSDKELTFKPQIVSKRSLSNGKHRSDADYENVYDRLYKEGEQRKKDLEAELEQTRKELEKENTFVPHVTSYKNNGGDGFQAPVFERLSASRQYVHEILTQIKSEFEMDQCTFHPTINHHSEEIAKTPRNVPIYLRLNSEAEKFKEDAEKRMAEYEKQERERYTFTPQLGGSFVKSKKSSHIISRSPSSSDNVFERLSIPQTPVLLKDTGSLGTNGDSKFISRKKTINDTEPYSSEPVESTIQNSAEAN